MILILGITASGKSRLAFELAKKLDAEIICIDSMKVYRRMNIGTAKPPAEARQQIKYHLIDIVEPSDSFSVGLFLEKANETIEQITSRNKTVIAVGGTALYIKALLHGLFDGPGTDEQIRKNLQQQIQTEGTEKLYGKLKQIDPAAAQRIHQNDSKRIIRAMEVYEITGQPISNFQQQFDTEPTQNWKIIGLRREKEIESKRINARVKKMLDTGLLDEVKSLLAEEKPLSKQAACAIGYAEIIDHLNGQTTLDETVELIKKNTRKLAKAQRTWFKTFKNVNWLDIKPEESAEKILERTMALINNLK